MLSFILLSSIIIYMQFYCTIVTTSNTDNHDYPFTREHQKNERISSNDQLIYEFAVKFKQISRLTLLSCTRESSKLMNNNEIQSNLLEFSSIKNITRSSSVDMISTILRNFFINQKISTKGILIKALQIDKIPKSKDKYVLDSNIDCTRTKNQINKTDDDKCNSNNDDGDRKISIEKILNLTIENLLKNELFRQIIVVDISCGINITRQILELASNKGMFSSSYHWLLIEDYVFNRPKEGFNVKHKEKLIHQDIGLIGKFLSGLNININTELIVATKKIDPYLGDYYQLYDIWNPGWQFGGKLNITNVGKFSQYNGLQFYDWYKVTTTITRRMDMKNVRIRCMIVVTNKFFDETLEDYLKSERDTHLDSMHRFNFKLLSHVRDIFNFKIDLYRTNSWGYLKNGTFDGMIGALVRHEIDIGGSPIFFRIERAKVIDYTAKTWIARPCFIFRQPNNNNGKRLIFLQPFTNDVWISIVVCGLLAIISGWSIHCAELYVFKITGTGKNNNKSIVELKPYKHLINDQSHTHDTNIDLNDKTGQSFGNWKNFSQKSNMILNKNLPSSNKNIKLKRNSFSTHVMDINFKTKYNQNYTIINKIAQGNKYDKGKMENFTEEYLHQFDIRKNNSKLFDTKEYGITFWDKLFHRILQRRQLLFKNSFSCNKSKVSIQKNENYWNFSEWRNNSNNNNNNHEDKNKKDKRIEHKVCNNDENYNGGDIHYIDSRIKRKFIKDTNMKMENINNKNITRLEKKSIRTNAVELFFDMIIFFISAFCMQGLPTQSVGIAGRLMILVTLFMVFLVYQFFSASIVGTLLSDTKPTITKLTDLINSSFEMGIEEIPYTRDFFRRTIDPDAIKLYRKIGGENNFSDNNAYRHSINASSSSWKKTIKKNPIWLQPDEGLSLVKDGGYAFHVDVATAYKIIRETFTEKEICELTEIQLFPPQKMVSIVQKGSSIRKIITYGLRRTEETGLMDRQRKFWHFRKPRCVKQIQPEDLSVDMQTFMSAILILIFGFVASIIILAFEFMHRFCMDKFL